MKFILVILAALAVTILPMVLTIDRLFRLDTDYDAVIPVSEYVASYMATYGRIPQRISYIGTGIPVIGDPLSPVLNPFYMVPLVIFGIEWGLRLVIVGCIIFSGISMYLLLWSIGIPAWLSVWGAILYETSGSLFARIAAGHIGAILAYPLVPLFLYGIFSSRLRVRVLTQGFAGAMIFLSGDFYALWFLILFTVAATLYDLITRTRSVSFILYQSVGVVTVFSLLSSWKAIAFIHDVYPFMVRYFPIHPFLGSLHLFMFPIPFLAPFRMSLYDRPLFQRLLGFHYNWYEYYAFISPTACVFLTSLSRVIKRYDVRLLLVFIVLGAFYLSNGFWYSPFHWLFVFIPSLQQIRVPQRVFMPLTAVVVALCSLSAARWRSSGRFRLYGVALCFISVVWTSIIAAKILYETFEPRRVTEEMAVRALRRQDPGNITVATFICCLQRYLISEHIRVLNYYYGWVTKTTETYLSSDGMGYDFSKLAKRPRPDYIFAKQDVSFTPYGYVPFGVYGHIRIWKTDGSTKLDNYQSL